MATQGNRLMDAILLNTEQEVRYRIDNPVGSQHDIKATQLTQQYYQDLIGQYRKRLTVPEKTTRQYLKNEIRKLKLKTNPGLVSILLYGRLSRWARNFLAGNKTVAWHRSMVQQYQNRIGNEQNFARLNHAIKQSGFTQNIDHILQKMIAQGLPRFHVRYTDIRHPNTDFTLHFSKIPSTSTYEFDRFEVASRPGRGQEDQQQWQSFSLKAETALSANEAAHIVNGRAVCKDENKWLILDKTDTFNPVKTISFDLVAALKELPLQKMNAVEFRNLVNSIKSGAAKEIELNINGESQKYQLIASPLSQSVRVLDAGNRLVDISSIMEGSQKQAENVSKLLNKTLANGMDMETKRGAKIR